MSDDERERDIEERAEKATAGPWTHEYEGEGYGVGTNDIYVGNIKEENDAIFIAHACEDIPWLLAQLAAVRRELDEAMGIIRVDKPTPQPRSS